MQLAKQTVLTHFERHLRSRNVSAATLTRYLRDIRQFFEISHVTDMRDLTREGVLAYIAALQDARTPNGAPRFSSSVIAGKVSTLRVLCAFLYRGEFLLANPCDGSPVNLHGHKNVRHDISVAQMARFLAAIDTRTPRGLRDRTMFELLYATGLRVGELSALNVEDIDLRRHHLVVTQGKGSRERLVPLVPSVLWWLEEYIRGARPRLRGTGAGEDASALFVSMTGRRLSRAGVEQRAHYYSERLWPGETHVTPHIFRHSFASHLLMNGAPVKDVSVLLGHTSIESTVGYTHFTVQSFRKIMKQYHPRENELYTENGRLAELRAILS